VHTNRRNVLDHRPQLPQGTNVSSPPPIRSTSLYRLVRERYSTFLLLSISSYWLLLAVSVSRHFPLFIGYYTTFPILDVSNKRHYLHFYSNIPLPDISITRRFSAPSEILDVGIKHRLKWPPNVIPGGTNVVLIETSYMSCLYLTLNLKVMPLECGEEIWLQKNYNHRAATQWRNYDPRSNHVGTVYECDKQTDGRTDTKTTQTLWNKFTFHRYSD